MDWRGFSPALPLTSAPCSPPRPRNHRRSTTTNRPPGRLGGRFVFGAGGLIVLVTFRRLSYRGRMSDPAVNLTPADPRDLADAIAFALRYSGGKRVRDADEVVATIAARRIVEHLRGARYRVMKRPLAERAARRELAAPLSPAEPEDVVKAIAFGLRFESGRRVWQADEYMAVITAKRLIEHLTLDGFVVLKLPPLGGHSALGQGFEG